MNLSSTADYSNSRAFSDEIRFDIASDTIASMLLRVIGSFGGGLALTALLAFVVRQ